MIIQFVPYTRISAKGMSECRITAFHPLATQRARRQFTVTHLTSGIAFLPVCTKAFIALTLSCETESPI